MDVKKILAEADIKINGNNPGDVKVNGGLLGQAKLQKRITKEGIYGLSDSYVDGEWDCNDVDVFVYKVLKAGVEKYFFDHPTELKRYNEEKEQNLQQGGMAKENIKMHYDTIPLEVYKATLDNRLAYSCGYWKDAKDLNAAQEAKLDLICKKLGLKKGMRVLDIGCGWGSFIRFAAEKYGVKCVGITLSENQKKYVDETKGDLPLKVELTSYENLKGSGEKFDRVVSVGMFEHVGHKNYRKFMKTVHEVLADDGLFLLHNFGGKDDTPNTTQPEKRWVERHVFQGMDLPSLGQEIGAAQGLFNVQDAQNFGNYYDPTLMAWTDNFVKAWPTLQKDLQEKYGDEFGSEKFFRFWTHYLKFCAGGFRTGKYQLWQVVFSKGDIEKVYEAIR